MTTRSLEDLDGGLGSCLPSDDLPLLEELHSGRRPGSKAQGASRQADSGSWTHVLQDPGTPGSAEKKIAAKEGPGTSKGTPKAETSARSVPARSRWQAAPPLNPPPPPPLSLSDNLPWGDLTLNKCLVVASLVALLGWVLQLCQNAVAGEVVVAAPQQWVPPSVPPKKPEVSLLKPLLSVPPSGPPEPKSGPPGAQALQQDKSEATEGSEQEASGEKRAPLGDRGSQERLQKEKPRKGEKLKKEKPRRDKPMTDERPRATREPRQSLPRRWTRDSRELKHEKRQTWALRRRHDGDDRSRQKPHGGKGRD